jgi:predicted DNA-binding transcriptional regulator AlpA
MDTQKISEIAAKMAYKEKEMQEIQQEIEDMKQELLAAMDVTSTALLPKNKKTTTRRYNSTGRGYRWDEAKKKEVKNALLECSSKGMTFNEAVKGIGIPRSTLYRFAKEREIEFRKVLGENYDKIKELAQEGISRAEIAKKLGCSNTKVWRATKNTRIKKKRGFRAKRWIQEEVDQVKKMQMNGIESKAIGKALGRTNHAISALLFRIKTKDPKYKPKRLDLKAPRIDISKTDIVITSQSQEAENKHKGKLTIGDIMKQ